MNKILIKKTVEIFFCHLLKEQELKIEFYKQFKLVFYNEGCDNRELSQKRKVLVNILAGPSGRIDKNDDYTLKGPFLKLFSDFARIGIYKNQERVSETEIILLNEFIQYVSTMVEKNFNEILDYFLQIATELLYES